jgi:hypothetical protein
MSGDISRDDPAVQAIVRGLVTGSVPERTAEIDRLWARYSPHFVMTGDVHERNHFILDAGSGRIRYNHRAARTFWLGGFVAWEAYLTAHRAADDGKVDLTRLDELISAFRRMMASSEPDKEALPAGVPEPGIYLQGGGNQQARAAGELATIALGWAVLHELRHIQHEQDGTGSPVFFGPEAHAEEMSCDRFATEFLLDRVSDHAAAESVAVRCVRQKREIGIGFALFTMVLLTEGHWEESDSHPPLQDRLDRVVASLERPLSDEFCAVVLGAFAVLKCAWPNSPTIEFECV